MNYISVTLPVSKKSIAKQQLLYTGMTDAPYALVNYIDKLVYFFDTKGLVNHTLVCPTSESELSYFGFTKISLGGCFG